MVRLKKQEVSKSDLPLGVSTEISIFKDQEIFNDLSIEIGMRRRRPF
jgi:hypothetical protein